MPVQIVDNFDLNSQKPIDNRFVVGSQSFYTHRDLITWKYTGMRIWDLNDNLPYVWTGTTYSSENQVALTGNGIANFVPKFVLPTQVQNSLIYDDGASVGIGTTTPFIGATPLFGLDVVGRIRSSSGFMGNGQFLQNINANNITLGLLQLARLQNGSINQLLTSGTGTPTWQNMSSISVGSATQLTTARTIWGQSFNGSANVTGNIQGAGTVQFGNFANKAVLQYASNYILTLNVPGQSSSGTKTIALLEQDPQTFTGVNKFSKTPTLTSGAYNTGSLQIGATSQFEFFPFSESSTFAIYVSSASNPTTTGRVIFSNFGAPIGQYSSFTVRDLHYFNTHSASGLISFGNTGNNDQVRFFMNGNTSVLGGPGVEIKNNLRILGTASVQNQLTTNILGAVTTQTQNLEVDGGTQIKKIVTGTVRVAYGGGLTELRGGTSYNLSLISGATNDIRFRVTPVSTFSSTNVVVVCAIDSTSVSHIDWQTLCYNRTSTFFDLRLYNPAWASGSVDVSFMAFEV